MGMLMNEVFLDCLQAFLRKAEAEPGAFAFEIDSLEPSHMDDVAITRVCTPWDDSLGLSILGLDGASGAMAWGPRTQP